MGIHTKPGFSYIVSTTCDCCGKRGKKCLEVLLDKANFEAVAICEGCLETHTTVLCSIKRRVTTKDDLK